MSRSHEPVRWAPPLERALAAHLTVVLTDHTTRTVERFGRPTEGIDGSVGCHH